MKIKIVKTFSAKPSDIKKNWLQIDAKGLVLGRLASHVANVLRGKHKASFTPHMDCGDNVVITNAEHVCLTGNKLNRKDGKIYYRHTGFPGGIKETTAGKILEGRFPERVIKMAVYRMLKKNAMRNTYMRNLYVYAGEVHPHAGQSPAAYDFASLNVKNKK